MTMNDQKDALRRNRLNPDPIIQFQSWLEQAKETETHHPDAMTLATSDANGKVAARIVLLRGLDSEGFYFYTNYESFKGADLSKNERAALVFHWPELSRQVRVEGRTVRATADQSDRYFAGRPRGHQLSAHASDQSRPLTDRAELEQRFAEAEERYSTMDVPRPEHWGGYRVEPDMIEFWQEGEFRVHDRFRYERSDDGGWSIRRLAP